MTKTQTNLNMLTTELTAFASWEQFENCMINRGYVPTLQHAGGRSKWAKRNNLMIDELRARLVEMGHRVFPETI